MNSDPSLSELTVGTWQPLQKTPMKIVEEEEEEVAEIQPDPLHQLILHFSHNALTERRWALNHCRKGKILILVLFMMYFFMFLCIASLFLIPWWLVCSKLSQLITAFQSLGRRSSVYRVCGHDGKGSAPTVNSKYKKSHKTCKKGVLKVYFVSIELCRRWGGRRRGERKDLWGTPSSRES